MYYLHVKRFMCVGKHFNCIRNELEQKKRKKED